jgi:hypothetical protein
MEIEGRNVFLPFCVLFNGFTQSIHFSKQILFVYLNSQNVKKTWEQQK